MVNSKATKDSQSYPYLCSWEREPR